jgi:hypothetical protein
LALFKRFGQRVRILPGLDKYTSSDGPIVIQQTGNAVVAVESFDEDSAKKLIEAGLKQAGENAHPLAKSLK